MYSETLPERLKRSIVVPKWISAYNISVTLAPLDERLMRVVDFLLTLGISKFGQLEDESPENLFSGRNGRLSVNPSDIERFLDALTALRVRFA